MRRIQLHAERSGYRKVTSLWFADHDGQRVTAVAQELTFNTVAEGEMLPFATLEVPDDVAQQFIDELWRAGFRPSEGTGSAGSLAATERHLEDMRRLVFGAYEATE